MCEDYACKFKIKFNASKSQLLFFSCKGEMTDNFCTLKMRDGNSIPYVNKCVHLGTTLYTDLYRTNIESAVHDLYRRTNYLLADFSFTESCTISNLFSSYCMNVYGCQLWQYNKHKCLEPLFVAWRKTIRRIWKINYRTHNNLLHHINNCLPIDIQLEKRCIKYIWNLINSEHKMYNRIVGYSLNNRNTIIGENVRYCMYKYKLSFKDWYSSLCSIYRKIDDYVTHINMLCTHLHYRRLPEGRNGAETPDRGMGDG